MNRYQSAWHPAPGRNPADRPEKTFIFDGALMVVSIKTIHWLLFPLIRKMNRSNQIIPKNHSATLGWRILGFILVFLAAVFFTVFTVFAVKLPAVKRGQQPPQLPGHDVDIIKVKYFTTQISLGGVSPFRLYRGEYGS